MNYRGVVLNNQRIIWINGNKEIYRFLDEKDYKSIFIVRGNNISKLESYKSLVQIIRDENIGITEFSGYEVNPDYESIVDGINLFNKSQYDAIFAYGGGSTIDVAKCIRLFAKGNVSENLLVQDVEPIDVDFIALPTTAGSGSESTRFAVIYMNGEKQSITNDACIPNAVFFDERVIGSLSNYQRKATMLDALGHAIESAWSIYSTDESMNYSKQAIKLIIANKDAYLTNTKVGNRNMLLASNYAGKAINISKTTAGHAMAYKLTSLYGIAHGHAVALCLRELIPFFVSHMDKCVDKRGKKHLIKVIEEIKECFGCPNETELSIAYDIFLKNLNMKKPIPKEEDYIILKSSVNVDRLTNSPIIMDEEMIDELYHKILGGVNES